MAKRFKLTPIPSIAGRPIQVPTFGKDGFQETRDDKPVTHDATLADIIDTVIRLFPQKHLTMDNITHGSRLRTQVEESKKKDKAILVVEEAEHDWLKKVLKEDDIGPKIFAFNLPNILDAVDGFERIHEKKSKE